MKLPLQLTFRGIDASFAVEEAMRRKVRHLERFYDGIVSCRAMNSSQIALNMKMFTSRCATPLMT